MAYIQLNRTYYKSWIYKKPNYDRVFTRLIVDANFDDDGDLERGQVIIGRNSLAKDTGLSDAICRTVIDNLVKKNELEKENLGGRKGTKITIINYDYWTHSGVFNNQLIDQYKSNNDNEIEENSTNLLTSFDQKNDQLNSQYKSKDNNEIEENPTNLSTSLLTTYKELCNNSTVGNFQFPDW